MAMAKIVIKQICAVIRVFSARFQKVTFVDLAFAVTARISLKACARVVPDFVNASRVIRARSCQAVVNDVGAVFARVSVGAFTVVV